MGHASEPAFVVLHALRLKGFAQPDAIAATSGLPQPEIEKILDSAAGDGLAQKREGRISGWALTSAGRERHAKLLSEEVEADGCRDAVDAAYRSFLEVNRDLLEVCTA